MAAPSSQWATARGRLEPHNGIVMIDVQRSEVRPLCRRYGVRRLDLFGSATTDAYDPSHLFDRYFGLKESLETLYGRSVDLVTAGSLRNPYFIEAVAKTRQPVYASEGAEAA